jgi:hypothetical protein
MLAFGNRPVCLRPDVCPALVLGAAHSRAKAFVCRVAKQMRGAIDPGCQADLIMRAGQVKVSIVDCHRTGLRWCDGGSATCHERNSKGDFEQRSHCLFPVICQFRTIPVARWERVGTGPWAVLAGFENEPVVFKIGKPRRF